LGQAFSEKLRLELEAGMQLRPSLVAHLVHGQLEPWEWLRLLITDEDEDLPEQAALGQIGVGKKSLL